MFKKSLLVRMIMIGFVLSILPVLLLGIFSYIQSSRQVQEQVNHAQFQILRQTNLNLEQTLKTVDHTLTALADSNVMSDALYNRLHGSDFQLYNNLRSEIVHLQSFDTMVEDVILVNREYNWMLKNSGIRRLNDHPDVARYMAFFQLQNDSSWVLLPKTDFRDAISGHSCAYVISLVKKLPSISTGKYGLALANIPACSLATLLDDGSELGELIVVDDQQRIMLHPDRELIGKPLGAHPAFADGGPLIEESGQMVIESDSHPYTLTYMTSGYNNWTYMSLVSNELLTAQSKQIGWFTLFLSLSIVVISLLFVWLSTKRLYSPVERLIQAITGEPGDANQSISKRTEVQVIEDHIKRLFQSNNKLEFEVQTHAQQVSSLFLTRLYGGNMRQSEIEQKMKHFEFDRQSVGWTDKAVLVMQIDTLENTRYHARDMELLLFAVRNIAEEAIGQEQRLPGVLMNQSLVLLVGFSQDGENKADHVHQRLYHISESLRNLIDQYLNIPVSIGISNPFVEIAEAANAYEQAIEALKYRIRFGKRAIIPFHQVNTDYVPIMNAYPMQVEHELVAAIKMGEQEVALTHLHQWMEEALHKEQTPGEYQVSLVRLLNRLLLLGQESGMRFKQAGANKSLSYEAVLKLQVVEEIEEWMKEQVVLPLLDMHGERRDSEDQNLSERIIDLIKNNFETDFTLEDVASKLHYNSSYLSSVFKKETNYTFSEYLAHYRLQMAKHYLTESELSVKDIAARLRYTNSNNFIRSFRKQEGMTPGQYRTKFRSYQG